MRIFLLFNDRIKKAMLMITLLFIYTNSAIAQGSENEPAGIIKGRIIDSVSSQAIEYATISLMVQENNKVINGTTTDDKGNFTLDGVVDGNYKILVYFIGYRTCSLNNIVVNKTNQNIDLGNIKLANMRATLKEVTVTSEKSIIENKIDKMVYNADKDITSQSGVATDVLKKVPQVSVDVNGNVELQGSTSIRFLINGKPSIIFGSNIADVLQSIPANQIQSIEVITSPGAKYDAEGTGGIINIILKKSTTEGVNGNISLSAGTRLENGSFNLNAHHKHFSANAFISGNAVLPSTSLNNMDRLTEDETTMQSTQLFQKGSSEVSRNGFESGLGFDWEITPKDNVSGSLGYDHFGFDNSGINQRESILKDSSGNLLSTINDQANSTNKFSENSLDYELSYKRKFKKEDQELEISYLSSNGKNNSNYKQTQQYVSPDSIYSGSYGNNPGTEKETQIAIDYTQPLWEDAELETGLKTEIVDVNTISNVYLLDASTDNYGYDATQSLSLDYKMNIYACYLSGSFELFDGGLDLKAGLRYEYTDRSAFFSNSGKVNLKPYDTYVPSCVISHKFKNEQLLKLSYTHRIERPDYEDLNPFINASDPKNLTTGNPNLYTELGDKIELGYNKTFKKGANILTTLFYRGNTHDIQGFTRYYSAYKVGDSTYSNVAVYTRENIGREDNYGINLFASIPVTSKINFRTNISCYERYILNGAALTSKNVHGFAYRINMNATYEVTNTLVIELFGNFNSARVGAQGTTPAFTTYNFALRKQFFHKKASIAITATNAFDKYVQQRTQLTGDNFTLNNLRQMPYRSFGINFTYKFGKLEFKQEEDSEEINSNNPPPPPGN